MENKKWLKYLMGVVMCLLLSCVIPMTAYATETGDKLTFTFIPYADEEGKMPVEELLVKESQLNKYAVAYYLNDVLVAEGNTYSCNKSDFTDGDTFEVVLYNTQTGEKKVRHVYGFKVKVASNGNVSFNKIYNEFGIHLANLRSEGENIYVVPTKLYDLGGNGGGVGWLGLTTAYSVKIVDTKGNPVEGYKYIGNSVFNMQYNGDEGWFETAEDVVTSNADGYFGTNQILNKPIIYKGSIPTDRYYYDDGFFFVNDENKADRRSDYGGLLRDTYPSYLTIEPDKENVNGYINPFGSFITLVTKNIPESKCTFSVKDDSGKDIGTVDVYAKDNALVVGGLSREIGDNLSMRVESNLTEDYSVSCEYVGERTYIYPQDKSEVSQPTYEITITFHKKEQLENNNNSTDNNNNDSNTKTDAVYTKKEFEKLLEKNKNSDVVIKSSDNVTLTFKKGTMKKVSGVNTYDFTSTMTMDYGNSKLPSSVKADKFVAKITYNYSGKLPAEATVKIFVGTKYSGKDVYYSLINGDGKLTEMKKATVDKDGYMTVKQSHCSDWVITTSDPTQEENAGVVDSPVVDNSIGAEANAENNTNTSPKTGDINRVWTYVVCFMGVVLIFAGVIKSKKVMR